MMDSQSAINEIINDKCAGCNSYENHRGCGCCGYYKAIKALEKQIEKEPVVTYSDNYVDEVYKCPNCKGLVDYKQHHCICGQALKRI